ncbi:hypothetical protein IV102_11400 [bacterium]|nr:hypothetical protein [bacterium]
MRSLAVGGKKPVDWQFLGFFETPLPLPDNFDFRSARIKAHLLAIYAQWPDQAAGILGEFGAQAFRVIFPDDGSIPANRVLLSYVPGQSVRQLLEQLQPEFSQEIFIDLNCLDRPDVFLSDRTGKLAAAEQRFWTQVGIPRMHEREDL